jgi:hypothetical protein
MKDITDVREFCFSGEGSPEALLAIWIAAHLTREQALEVKRMWAELLVDGVKKVTVDDMVSVIEMAKFLR